MRPVLSADEMRWCDEFTIKKLCVPGLLLMENAGSAVARTVQDRVGPLAGKTIAIFCGKGNNGGDGFVVARMMVHGGVNTVVLLVGTDFKVKGDARTNLEILKKLQKTATSLQVKKFSTAALKDLRPDIIVDAIFGTGFSGKVREPVSKAI
ncbi:MAG TPA: NAD(P)H-hydrate epimerase, partial [Bacteroidota bacterium]|nr:NAD(P)H-hydrate epimerase [Bacteroidota bacterium]